MLGKKKTKKEIEEEIQKIYVWQFDVIHDLSGFVMFAKTKQEKKSDCGKSRKRKSTKQR